MTVTDDNAHSSRTSASRGAGIPLSAAFAGSKSHLVRDAASLMDGIAARVLHTAEPAALLPARGAVQRAVLDGSFCRNANAQAAQAAKNAAFFSSVTKLLSRTLPYGSHLLMPHGPASGAVHTYLRADALIRPVLPNMARIEQVLKAAEWWRSLLSGVRVRLGDERAFVALQARATLALLMDARDAVLQGDDETLKELLREFLGYRRMTPDRLEAARTVLLEDGWMPDEAEERVVTVDLVRLLVDKAHQDWRPLWEIQVRSYRIGLLDEPIRAGEGNGEPFGRTVASQQDTEQEALANIVEDHLLTFVLGQLDDQQRAIVKFKADNECTWKEAELCLRLPAGLAEKTRRRIHYILRHYRTRFPHAAPASRRA